jgi:D-sedoheptulose 7-phosphate isomerase
MKSTFTSCFIGSMKSAMDGVQANLLNGESMELDGAFAKVCDLTTRLKETGGVLYFVGNGASATMSSHMAVDFCKNGGVRSMALNDAAFLTAIGNDMAFSQVFELPLKSLGRPGDMLATISSSGNSPNVVTAIKAARERGMSVVTFSGMTPENKSRTAGDVNFWLPCKTYGVAESVHAILLHCWLDKYMNIREWEK